MRKYYLPFLCVFFLISSVRGQGQIESFDNAVGSFFPDPSVPGQTFFQSPYGNSVMILSNNHINYQEGSGSMQINYSVEDLDPYWGGWVVSTTYDVNQNGTDKNYIDLSKGTFLSFWCKVLNPVTFTSQSKLIRFEVKLAEFNDLGQRDLWQYSTPIDLSNNSGDWLNVKIPLIKSQDSYLGLSPQIINGDGILQLDKIKGFEIAFYFEAAEESNTIPTATGSILIDDLALVKEIVGALNETNHVIDNLTISSGLKNSLMKKINQAITKYNQGKLNVVNNVLTDFISQLYDLIAANKISQVDGQNLIDYSYLIIKNLNSDLAKDNIKDNVSQLFPTQLQLNQNYPNPFNPSTKINFQLPSDGFVTLKVYDVLGNEVGTLINSEKTAGSYEVNFDASSLPSGTYLYRLLSGGFVETKKMILLK
jgi:hypothetical protein